MPGNPNLFNDTFAAMESGDTLIILGGTFPGENETAEVQLGLQKIIPFLNIVTGGNEHPLRDNPVFNPEDEDPLTVELERNDKRFGHDYGDGPTISFGKGAAVILGHTVDVVILNPMTKDVFYFIAKPSGE